MPARPVPFCLSAPVRAKKGRMESANRGRRAGTPSQVQGPRTGPGTRFASHPVPVHTIHGRNGMAKTDGRRSAGRGGVRRPFAAGPLWLVHQQLAAVSAWHGMASKECRAETRRRWRRNRTYAHPPVPNRATEPLAAGRESSRNGTNGMRGAAGAAAGRTLWHARHPPGCPQCSTADSSRLQAHVSFHQNVQTAQPSSSARRNSSM